MQQRDPYANSARQSREFNDLDISGRSGRMSGGKSTASSMVVSSAQRQRGNSSMVARNSQEKLAQSLVSSSGNQIRHGSAKNLNQSALLPGSFQFGGLLKQKTQAPPQLVIKPPKNKKECENFENLPMEATIAHKSQFNEREICQTCPVKFNLLNKRHHCRVCAASICSDCQVKRRLSKTDAEVYPVCIQCDF